MNENSPYLGLRPYQESEKDKFFGRQQEIHILTDKILAHRLTLLVAASGVGKSSLLQAGVMPTLRASGMADLIYHNSWAVNPAQDLKQTIVEHFIHQQRISADYQPDFALPLVDFLRIHTLLGDGTVIILLDQFEEFFYYQRFSQQRDEFIQQLASAIRDTDTPTTFVFSMREDFAMEMEAFKPWLSSVFNNIYRIEKLELEAARLAITEPVKPVGFGYQPELVELLLKDLGQRERSERLDLQHIDEQFLTAPLVEPPHLQIVCQQLWLTACNSPEHLITLAHYEILGTASGILKRYFNDKMAILKPEQQRLASKAFDLLVSQHGAKMSYPLDELASLLAEDASTLQLSLDQLQSTAILRRIQRQGKPWYELYHDIFAKSIVEWNQAYKRKQLRKKLAIWGMGVFSAGVALLVAYDSWENYHQRHFRLGKETISERVELYQGQLDSWDLFHQQHFLSETDFERKDIEADKRFETVAIAELEQSALMQIGQLPLEQRFLAYAQVGIFENADKVYDAIHKADNENLISSLIPQLTRIRVRQSVDRLLALKNTVDSSFLGPKNSTAIKSLAGMNAANATAKLVDLLEDSNAVVRRTAIQALATLNAKTAIPQLLGKLEDSDADVRRTAIQALATQNAETAIPQLLDKLEDSDANVRRASIQALATLNAETAIPQLIDKLEDSDADVRWATIKTLATLNAETAIPQLLDRLEDSDADVRKVAIQALATLNAETAIPQLIGRLEDYDTGVRVAAIQALATLNAETAIPQLIGRLKDKDADVREAAIQALGILNAETAIPQLIGRLKDKDADVREAAIQALGILNAETAIPQLLDKLKDNDAVVRRAAIQALATQNAETAIPQLLDKLKDNDADVRKAAIQALATLNAETAIPQLLDRLEDSDADVRWATIKTLATLNAETAIPQLLDRLEDSDADVRRAAIQALGILKAEKSVPQLLNVLTTLKVEEIDSQSFLSFMGTSMRRTAIQALKTMKVEAIISNNGDDTNTTQELKERLNGDDINDQQDAAWTQRITKLEAKLKLATNNELNRAEIAQALGFVPVLKAVILLAPLLKDNSAYVVSNALTSLVKIGEYHPQWLQPYSPRLIELSRNKDVDLQETAIKALGQLITFAGNDSAENFKELDQTVQQQLQKIATDPQQANYLRYAAVDAFGSTKRAEIADFLGNLLQDPNQETLHFRIASWLANMPHQPDKELATLKVLHQRLAVLEREKATWREHRDADQPAHPDDDKTIVSPEETYKRSWHDDYKIYQYAYAIAKMAPETEGIAFLSHPLYPAREAAIRALAEKANGALVKKLIEYHQAFNPKQLPSPRPYATYRALDLVLQRLEIIGNKDDLEVLNKLSNITLAMTTQQQAFNERLSWTIAELDYRLQNKADAK